MTQKLHNISVGEILNEEFLIPMGLSQNKLSKKMGCSRSFITHIIKNRRKVSKRFDKKLTEFFGLSEGYFLRLQDAWAKEEYLEAVSDSLIKVGGSND